MKKENTIVVPETTKIKTEYFCDLCGRELSQDRAWGITAKMFYEKTETNEIDEIDICVKCMEKVVMPMVRSVYKIERETLTLTP